jgi:hypothetical protein
MSDLEQSNIGNMSDVTDSIVDSVSMSPTFPSNVNVNNNGR